MNTHLRSVTAALIAANIESIAKAMSANSTLNTVAQNFPALTFQRQFHHNDVHPQLVPFIFLMEEIPKISNT